MTTKNRRPSASRRLAFLPIVAAAALLIVPAGLLRAEGLNQGAFVSGSETYQFGHHSIPNIPITGAPADTDWNRSAALHDGSDYRLYFFRSGSRHEIYQFAFNRRTECYEFGYNSIPVLRLRSIPSNASTQSFAMLHDGSTYRLYLQDASDCSLLYQFGFNRSSETYDYGYDSIPQLRVAGIPRDADWSRWMMLHDGNDYRFYVFRANSITEFYQAGYDPRREIYEWGHNSIPVMEAKHFPANSQFAVPIMLHDGIDYRLYFPTR
ncbi:MAG: hypothetical protein AAF236_07760 [Verrucomicrobiota bacterium]